MNKFVKNLVFEYVNRVVRPIELIENKKSLTKMNGIGNGGFANSVRTWLSVVQFNERACLFWRIRDHSTTKKDFEKLSFIKKYNYHEVLKNNNYASWIIIPKNVKNFPYIFNCVNKMALYTPLILTDEFNDYRLKLLSYYQKSIKSEEVVTDQKYIGIHLRTWTDLISYDGSIKIPKDQDFGAYFAKIRVDRNYIEKLALKVLKVGSDTGISNYYCACDNKEIRIQFCNIMENYGLINIDIETGETNTVIRDFEMLRKATVIFRTPGSTFSHLSILLSDKVESDFLI